MDNPGNLYGKVHPDNFPNENDYRNPIIAVAMKTLGYVNQFGRGVETVQEELKANKNGLAVFKFDDITTFKVTVMSADLIEDDSADGAYKTEVGQKNKNNVGDKSEISRRSVGEGNGARNATNEATNEAGNEAISEAINITSRQTKILQLIKEDNRLTRESIAKKLKVSESSVYRDIERLKEIGKLKRIGGNKGGHWKIN